ncbi:MAG: hypothetical protein EOO41_01460 [Methanobacteriota archaeon]|nr:MAG: hypothetical protein EOO41_01460 [Euryarchaeota archaeon]
MLVTCVTLWTVRISLVRRAGVRGAMQKAAVTPLLPLPLQLHPAWQVMQAQFQLPLELHEAMHAVTLEALDTVAAVAAAEVVMRAAAVVLKQSTQQRALPLRLP